MKHYNTTIGLLGGGIAGLACAYFLERPSTIFERNKTVGGLSRSYEINGLYYDIGPHIIFSKNKEVLDFINTISDNQQLERSNMIFHNGQYIKYPFENFLAQLNNQKEIDYCLDTFLGNSYENIEPNNMLAFFLKTFGEGITRLYLQPYNEKIWKFDPSALDLEMVERIPKPPREHIISSAKGEFHEGYTHQLHFYYPKKNGAGNLCDGLLSRIKDKTEVKTDSPIIKIYHKDKWNVQTDKETLQFDTIINCMPIHELIKVLDNVPDDIRKITQKLLYNSIYIVIVNVKKDSVGENFSITIADRDTIFHRMNKLDFLGDNYKIEGSSTFMLEVTFREGDKYSKMSKEEVTRICIKDMVKNKFIDSEMDVNFTDFRREKYAYVINDLDHRKNTDTVLSYLKGIGIESCGRFAEFEYLNSDKVIEHAMNLSATINQINK